MYTGLDLWQLFCHSLTNAWITGLSYQVQILPDFDSFSNPPSLLLTEDLSKTHSILYCSAACTQYSKNPKLSTILPSLAHKDSLIQPLPVCLAAYSVWLITPAIPECSQLLCMEYCFVTQSFCSFHCLLCSVDSTLFSRPMNSSVVLFLDNEVLLWYPVHTLLL